MKKSTKILVVDDNPANLKLVSDLLGFEGFEVQRAKDAQSCLDMLQGDLPDVILMDVAMPGMDGLQLTRLLKSSERTRSITIIALTAFAMKTDRDRVMAAGCDGYITKPIETRGFISQVRQYLKNA